MFDSTVEINMDKGADAIKTLAGAATMAKVIEEPPVRVTDGKEEHWIRPSNVLRVESKLNYQANAYHANIVFTDGGELFLQTGTSEVAAQIWDLDDAASADD